MALDHTQGCQLWAVIYLEILGVEPEDGRVEGREGLQWAITL